MFHWLPIPDLPWATALVAIPDWGPMILFWTTLPIYILIDENSK
jgi:hypothetical protein